MATVLTPFDSAVTSRFGSDDLEAVRAAQRARRHDLGDGPGGSVGADRNAPQVTGVVLDDVQVARGLVDVDAVQVPLIGAERRIADPLLERRAALGQPQNPRIPGIRRVARCRRRRW
jgi:hypothetical protein